MFHIAGSQKGSIFSKIKIEPNDIGRKQFYEYQTNGKYKHEKFGYSKIVDNYFFVLKEGKHKFDLAVREYQQMYLNGEFWGFYQLWLDWKGDRWILPQLCKWYKGELPKWLTSETEEINEEITEETK